MPNNDSNSDGECRVLLFRLPPELALAKLWREHEAEAEREGAEFWSYGKVTTDDSIYSKTTIGYLESWLSAGGGILHCWTRW